MMYIIYNVLCVLLLRCVIVAKNGQKCQKMPKNGKNAGKCQKVAKSAKNAKKWPKNAKFGQNAPGGKKAKTAKKSYPGSPTSIFGVNKKTLKKRFSGPSGLIRLY